MNTSANWSEMHTFSEITAPRVFHLVVVVIVLIYNVFICYMLKLYFECLGLHKILKLFSPITFYFFF